ncbi:hypothetical protein HPP92_024520 [Vanilla planifolia]|uniref:glutathione transferase n=1 Tax=Vanilla planifolia TaxID=51239 RepID=A0A835PVB9_VANPL|nr:hypothetical protein HPP92_024520 [Vanilla planifolia]
MAASATSVFARSSIFAPNYHVHLRSYAPRGHKSCCSSSSSLRLSPLPRSVPKESFYCSGRLGPFSQRVLLTLEEKNLPYDLKLVNLDNKPDWFLKISPEGKVPVAKFDDTWVADSDIITQAIERSILGSKIFSAFISFLKSKDPQDGTDETLVSELASFNEYLKENGPFVNGEKFRQRTCVSWTQVVPFGNCSWPLQTLVRSRIACIFEEIHGGK